MQLHFVSRQEYQLRHERYYHEELLVEYPNYYIVPEGGANYLGMVGCQEIVAEIKESFDRIVVAQGTTATSCGVLLGLSQRQRISVVPVLKGFQSREEMQTLLGKTGVDFDTIDELMSRLEVLDQYHFGGYAKTDTTLLEFIRSFYKTYGMRLDPVYTGKALFAFWKEMKLGKYDGEHVVFLHTGGLQGVHGIEERTGCQLFD
jgi:1-aminocyclopropane-1-carboxylate deaminase